MKQGISRSERRPRALDPSSFRLDNRTLKDLYTDSKAFARSVVFEDPEGEKNWEALFEEGSAYLGAAQQSVPAVIARRDCPPHLALFFSFLGLFEILQLQYNELTREQLLFFYGKILRQNHLPMVGDEVFVFLELARNTDSFLLPQGTGFFAGKDVAKKDIIFRTTKDTYLNKAGIASINAIYNRQKPGDSVYVFRDLPQMHNQLEHTGGTTSEATGTGWFPFGDPDLVKESARMGFGLHSPILQLDEGERLIEVAVMIDEQGSQTLRGKPLNPEDWDVHLSIPDGSIIRPLHGLSLEGDQLVFAVHLDKTEPPIMASMGTGTAAAAPPLQFVLARGFDHRLYNLLQSIHVSGITVKVQVSGLENLIIQNDFGRMDVRQAFQPFGFTPVLGANFYIQSPELLSKNITKGVVKIQWKGLPENLKAYYEGYLGQTNSLVEHKEDFKVALALRKRREWTLLRNDGGNSFTLFQDQLDFHLDPLNMEIPGDPSDPGNNTIRLTLSAPKRAFGHNLYPSVYARAIMAQVQLKDEPIPNPPYTPTIESISLDYEASEVLLPGRTAASGPAFFHSEPFGYSSVADVPGEITLLPPGYNSGGQLYLGISQLTPPQQLTLFFEIRPENVLDKPDIRMSYLSEGGWKKLARNQLLSDATRSLTQTGIITLNIPADASKSSTQMARGLHWVKIETPGYPERFDRIFSLRANAALCMLDRPEGYTDYHVNGLLPNSITSLAVKNGQISKIEQPYPSFGGRPAETDAAFFVRISERLAHKDRGVTAWDIERLILQQFQEIYQVISHPVTSEDGAIRAGAIHVIIIPRIVRSSSDNIRRPLASAAMIRGIREFLLTRVSPHITLTVGNPDYEELQIHATVSFRDDVDAGFYLKKLEDALKRFLSPWAFSGDQKMEMGTRLYKSAIIKFIEHQPYINFVARIKIYKNRIPVNTDEILTSRHSILISADTHALKTVEPGGMVCQTKQGISQMIVDINFQVE